MRQMQPMLIALGLWLFTAGAAAQVLPTKPEVTHLKNGLTVVMVPWDSPGMVAYYHLVRTGSRDETEKGHTGFAHLFEHVMFRGTDRFPKEVYEAKIQEFGADNNAFTWFNLTCYTVVVPNEVLPDLIEIEADRFQNLKFSEEHFKTETGAVLGEYNMNASNPGLLMEEKLLETAFKKHTYGHTTMGYLDDVKAMPKYYDYAKKFHRWYYTPDNVTVIVIGDFNAESTLKKIEAEYGNWKGKRRKTRAKKEPEQREARSVHVPWKGPTSPKMTLAYKIPVFSTTGSDSAALEVIAQLVFGESSPLYRKLVIEDQKVLGLRASHGIFSPPSPDPFLFQVDVTLKEGTTFDEIQEEVTRALIEVADGKIPAERIEAVKSHSRYEFLLGLETPKDVAAALAMLMSATGDPGSIDAFGKALAEVSPEDVVKAAKLYLTEKRRTVVTMASEKGGAK
ncbi:MAG: insulinase family protein [Deltaproteobacteria bacterium]|nr:insulinase family protein [Deltaproteobacteria bacterium]